MFRKILILWGCLIGVSCGEGKDIEYVRDPLNPGRLITKDKAAQIGKITDLGKSGPSKEEFRVNKYLWDACLDILKGIPSEKIEPKVGIYETAYVPSSGKDIKVQCRVKGGKILSKNLEVTVTERNPETEQISSFSGEQIRGQILLRARELKANDI
ncbi:MAG: DUF3576 domain-containing protein [Pseudomonadota bacterium]